MPVPPYNTVTAKMAPYVDRYSLMGAVTKQLPAESYQSTEGANHFTSRHDVIIGKYVIHTAILGYAEGRRAR